MSTLSATGHSVADGFVKGHAPLSDKWDHEYGVLLRGLADLYSATGNDAYLRFVRDSLDPLISEDGSIRSYHLEAYEMDNIVSGRALLSLYREDKTPKYRKTLDFIRGQFDSHPKASFGNYLHKGELTEMLLIESIYMGMPFLAEYESSFGSGDFEDVYHNILTAYRLNYREAEGLMVHGYDASKSHIWADPDTGLSGSFWGRGLGWYVVGCIETLDYLPRDDPRTQEVRDMLGRLLKNLLKYQHASGSWYQVIDQGDRQGNYLEASASAMFTYALCKGISEGYVEASYKPHARRAYEGLIKNFVVERGGTYTLVGTCASGGLGGKAYRDGSFASYACEATKDDDLKGLGVLFMATAAFDKMGA